MTNETPTPDQSRILIEAVAGQIIRDTSVDFNVRQNLIVITEDKVCLCLQRHLERLGAKRGWIAPAGILITILATFATTTFHPFYVGGATWEAIFIVAAVLNLYWLIRSGVAAWKGSTIEDVVGEMKREGASRVQG